MKKVIGISFITSMCLFGLAGCGNNTSGVLKLWPILLMLLGLGLLCLAGLRTYSFIQHNERRRRKSHRKAVYITIISTPTSALFTITAVKAMRSSGRFIYTLRTD